MHKLVLAGLENGGFVLFSERRPGKVFNVVVDWLLSGHRQVADGRRISLCDELLL